MSLSEARPGETERAGGPLDEPTAGCLADECAATLPSGERGATLTSGERGARPLDERTAGRLLGGLLIAVTLLRLALAWRYFGFLSGDDVEILEAGWRALGLHYVPWEIRNTLLPDLLVRPVLLAAHALGVVRPRLLVWMAAWPFVGLATLNVYLLYRLVRGWSSRLSFALASACLYGLHWIPLGFATMTYPRTPAVACVLAAALLVAPAPRRPWRELLAGAALALAFACRYSEAVYLPAVALAAAWPLGGRRARSLALLRVAAGFAAGALLAAGAYETATWGRPFAALLAFARFTLIEKQSSSLTAAQPIYWYFWRLSHWWSPPAWILAGQALDRSGRHRVLIPLAWVFVFVPLLLLSCIHHKELRYLQGVIPFTCAIAAAGACDMWLAGRRRSAAVLLAAALAWQLVPVGFLRKKSMPAVLAAEALAADPTVRTFAGVQLWAYGDRIYLGDRRALRDIPYPTSAADVARLGAGADAVALYAEDLARQPALGAALGRLGFCAWRDFSFRPAKTVSLWRPCPGRRGGDSIAPAPTDH
jgi:hypothetical protein